jgi:hypothetical protein
MTEKMTLDEFAKLIEANLRNMQAEQTRLIEAAVSAGLDPENCIGIMSEILAKIEREQKEEN